MDLPLFIFGRTHEHHNIETNQYSTLLVAVKHDLLTERRGIILSVATEKGHAMAYVVPQKETQKMQSNKGKPLFRTEEISCHWHQMNQQVKSNRDTYQQMNMKTIEKMLKTDSKK